MICTVRASLNVRFILSYSPSPFPTTMLPFSGSSNYHGSGEECGGRKKGVQRLSLAC